MVSITLQWLLLVCWICLNKTEWISQHDDDDDINVENMNISISGNIKLICATDVHIFLCKPNRHFFQCNFI